MNTLLKKSGYLPKLLLLFCAAAILLFEQGARAQGPSQVVTNEPPPKWDASAAAGLTLTRGNSHSTLVTGALKADRKTTRDELLMALEGAYGSSSGIKNVESLAGSVQYNKNLTERIYVGLKVDGLHDGIADIQYRFTISPLAGYYLIKATNTTLVTEIGPSFVYEKKGGHTDDYLALRLGERYEYKFSATAKVWEKFEIFPQVDKFENYYINASAGIEAMITKKTSLLAYVVDSYYNEPAPGRGRNDVQLVSALKYNF